MGTKLCFYEFESATGCMTPQHVFDDPEFRPIPQEWWDCDVLEDDGEQRLRALATHITEACIHLEV
ncbi:hypothetical protein J3R82DRAFT_3681 [Butyriboletus roseoflavus]|nr:hypothetical protein J3R82DRAFT_3681 [Butyriboletus roseoflavus]